jgi:DNA-cytosine methyltransferase
MSEFNVLSLFDGCSCAMIALDRLGVKPDNYFASEIDKYAIQVSKANWRQIKHIGDVTKINYFEGVLYTEFGNYTVSFANGLICGGSPCQGFSFAGKQLNFEDPRSKLFFEFVRIYEEIKAEHPDVKVFLENVVMKKEYQAVISEALGMQCVMVNSSLVSAQNRKRLYWTNIPFQGQPADRGILLKDILEDNCTTVLRWQNKNAGAVLDDQKGATLRASGGTDIRKRMKVLQPTGVVLNHGEYQQRNEKAMCLDANYFKGADNHGQRTMIQVGMASDIKGRDQNRRIYSDEGKSPTLICTTGGHHEPKVAIRQINPSKDAAGKQPYMQDRVYDPNYKSIAVTTEYASRLKVGETMQSYRKLTPVECERLQCVDDNYTKYVSDSQRYKMLGNGWNVDTIVHLFEPLLWLDII